MTVMTTSGGAHDSPTAIPRSREDHRREVSTSTHPMIRRPGWRSDSVAFIQPIAISTNPTIATPFLIGPQSSARCSLGSGRASRRCVDSDDDPQACDEALLAGRGSHPLAALPGDQRSAPSRPADHDLRAAGQAHRLPQDPRGSLAPGGRRLHLPRPRGADHVDRSLRPGQGRDARAVPVDADPRRRARRAASPGLGAAVGPPLRPRGRQGGAVVPRHPRPRAARPGAGRRPRGQRRGAARPPRGPDPRRRRVAQRHRGGCGRGRQRRRARRAHRVAATSAPGPSTRR